jgi:hypothetical protein
MSVGWRERIVGACALVGALLGGAPSEAANRVVLVVSGADGGEPAATNHARWRTALAQTLRGTLRLPADRVIVLRDALPAVADSATREHVRDALARLQPLLVSPDDLLCIVLIGHGTYDGVSAKFNLVGPDLDEQEWKALVAPIKAQTVFVNTTGASFPFMEALAGDRRVVITATATAAQKYDTVFAEYFAGAFADAAADLDKDARVSIWEAFTYASTRVKRHYELRGQLATERPVLDDNGDGLGKEAGESGPDGVVASRMFLDAGPEIVASPDPAASELIARRDRLEADLNEVKRKKGFMPPDDYQSELERVLVELARVSRVLRQRTRS